MNNYFWKRIFLVVGQLWEKKNFWLGQMVIFESIFLPSTKKWHFGVKTIKSFFWRFCIFVVFWKVEKCVWSKNFLIYLVEKRVCQIVTIGCWRKHGNIFFNAPNVLNDFGPNILISPPPFSPLPTDCCPVAIVVHKRQNRDMVDIAVEADWRQT